MLPRLISTLLFTLRADTTALNLGLMPTVSSTQEHRHRHCRLKTPQRTPAPSESVTGDCRGGSNQN